LIPLTFGSTSVSSTAHFEPESTVLKLCYPA
jgi:hypothetical protein